MSGEDGLEKLGIATGKHLHTALTTSNEPLDAIAEFQNVNGIDAESLKIALPFLDLHGVKRLTLHTSIFEAMRERLLKVQNVNTYFVIVYSFFFVFFDRMDCEIRLDFIG